MHKAKARTRKTGLRLTNLIAMELMTKTKLVFDGETLLSILGGLTDQVQVLNSKVLELEDRLKSLEPSEERRWEPSDAKF